jgi:hypothetical protein
MADGWFGSLHSAVDGAGRRLTVQVAQDCGSQHLGASISLVHGYVSAVIRIERDIAWVGRVLSRLAYDRLGWFGRVLLPTYRRVSCSPVEE